MKSVQGDDASSQTKIRALEVALDRARSELSWAVAQREAAERQVEDLRIEINILRASMALSVSDWLKSKVRLLRRLPGFDTAARRFQRQQLMRLVEASAFFDSAWYAGQYGDRIEPGQPPIAHYFANSLGGEFDPSPSFSTRFYLNANPDVADSGMDPLAHYLLFGRAEGRDVTRSSHAPGFDSNGSTNSFAIDGALETEGPVISEVVSVGRIAGERLQWTAVSVLETRQDREAVRVEGILLGWQDGSAERAGGSVDGAVAIFRRLSGRSGSAFAAAAMQPLAEHVCIALASLETGGQGRVDDIWLVTNALLRMRTTNVGKAYVVRAYQYDRNDRFALVSESAVETGDIGFFDLAIEHPYLPLLLIVSEADGTIIRASLIPFPSLCRGGPHFAETFVEADGATYRDRLETVSRRALRSWAAGIETGGFAVARIKVDTISATGAELIFNPQLLGWLNTLGVSVDALKSAGTSVTQAQKFLQESLAQAATGSPRGGFAELWIAGDFIPTIAAMTRTGNLFRPGEREIASAFLSGTRPAARGSQTLISVPRDATTLLDLQPYSASLPFPVLAATASTLEGDYHSPQANEDGTPFGIVSRDLSLIREANLIFPVAPDASVSSLAAPKKLNGRQRLLAIVPDAEDVPVRLRHLAHQRDCDEILSVLLCRPERSAQVEQAIATDFKGQGKILVPHIGLFPSIRDALRDQDGDLLLLLSPGVVIHDRRTLATLVSLAMLDDAASAGCASINATHFKGNRQISINSLGLLLRVRANGQAELSEAEDQSSLPFATYPVALNAGHFFMSRRDKWERMGSAGHIDETGAMDDPTLIQAAIRLNLRHLCTSAVTVGLKRPLPPRNLPVASEVDLAAFRERIVTIETLL